jgi:hypothetical protein
MKFFAFIFRISFFSYNINDNIFIFFQFLFRLFCNFVALITNIIINYANK